MKTNKAMRNLLNEFAQLNESISSNLFNPTFHEWDDCILVDASSLREIDFLKKPYIKIERS